LTIAILDGTALPYPVEVERPNTLRQRPTVSALAEEIAENCRQCRKCMAECNFLSINGPPGKLSGKYPQEPQQLRRLAYSCSLCGLCSKVCPSRLNPTEMFLALRRESIRLGETDLRKYRRLLSFERAGGSRLIRTLSLPAGCTSVFFPGCALPAIRPHQTLHLYKRLRGIDPTMGIMLDCCNKPSHDLGREQHFEDRFNTRMASLSARGIRSIVTACPSCFQAFSALPHGLTVTTVYGLLAGQEKPRPSPLTDRHCTIHDPCATRFSVQIHEDVRQLCRAIGVTPMDMTHSRENTICCGEGGGAGCTASHLSNGWRNKRLAEADKRPLITYCAGCTSMLEKHGRTFHVVDLLFPDSNRNGKSFKPATPFRGWINRLLVKMLLKSTSCNDSPE